MESCCSFKVIVGKVCGCNPKDQKQKLFRYFGAIGH